MELNVLNEQSKVSATDAVFGREYNEALVHQIVVAFQANARLGTRAQLTRAEVHHSTKKPWRQKGTGGRARSGMTSSPVWRSGGRAFPNSPDENFSQKVNKKMFRAAMASIYSKLVADDRFSVIETIKVDLPKTKAFAEQLKTLGLTGKVLVLIGKEEDTDNLFLASRNLKNVLVVTPRYADPLSLLFYDKVVATKAAVAQIEEILA